MARLPIYELEADIVAALGKGNRLIVEAPTGSGKSTQVPQILLEHGLAGNGRIAVLQPRRIAARMLSRRVAVERRCRHGGEVGYQVRFERHCTDRTRIKYETDGILLRELLGDPGLRQVSVIVFDEFHERHLNSDLMLGFALRLQAGPRPDLKIVIMSATLDAQTLKDALAPCAVVRSEGRAYPVDIRYLKKASQARQPAWDLAAEAADRLLREHPEGDMLVFMPGAYEIRRTVEALGRRSATRGCVILPLHGALPPAEQDRALMPAAARKIVVATNVAETSLTIEGITMVVDSGLARKARFDARRGINTLLVEKICRSSADQRAGRAGRMAPGHCARLWTEREHTGRPFQDPPELHRVDLAETVLQLRTSDVRDITAFPWVDAPLPHSVEKAERLLSDLGALDGNGEITALGRKLVSFPLHPRVARMLVAAEYFGCVPTVCLLAALLQERNILLHKVGAAARERRIELAGGRLDSDLWLLVRAWEAAADTGFRRETCEPIGVHGVAARSAGKAAEQLERIARAEGLDCCDAGASPESLHRCTLAGFPDQVAKRVSRGAGRCAIVHGRRGTISADSVVAREHELLVAAEIQEIGNSRGDVDVRLSALAAIRPEWIEQAFSGAFSDGRRVFYDPAIKRVCAEKRVQYHDLVISARGEQEVGDDEAAALLAAEVTAGRLTLKHWDAKVERWLARVHLVAENCPETGVPAVHASDRRDMVEQVCHGARSYKDIKGRAVWPVVKAWLSAGQKAAVDAYAPERVRIENGREPRVLYDDPANGPYVAMRIQELYDTHKLPALCMGRVPLRIHILAPNQRPVQITHDLESFWREGYPRAKKELRGRYPKHEWR